MQMQKWYLLKLVQEKGEEGYKGEWQCWEPVAHAYNPSYVGGRDQEDQGSKPAWANS
jgi:hypothetical protein